MYFCKACGESEEFRCTWNRELRQEMEGQTNADGDITHEEVTDEDEYDNSDYEYFCNNCDEEVEDLSENEIDKLKILHTDKDGEWSEDELEEEDQNKELASKIIASRI